jgi:glycine cleavage system aminomethyltransferase T
MRRLCGFVIQGDRVAASEHRVSVLQNDTVVGSISEMAYSSRLEKNIGIGLISNTIADDVDDLCVSPGSELRSVTIHSLPFIR